MARENINFLVWGYLPDGRNFQGHINASGNKMGLLLPRIESPKKIYNSRKGQYIIRDGKRLYFGHYTHNDNSRFLVYYTENGALRVFQSNWYIDAANYAEDLTKQENIHRVSVVATDKDFCRGHLVKKYY